MGIDVSHYQGKVDWTQVVTEHGFAFAKATEGIHTVDAQFATNWTGMKAAGILRGAFHFYLCQEDPTQQAMHFANELQSAGYEDTDLPPVLDLEDRAGATAVGATKMIADVHTWFQVVKAQLGRIPILYCDHSFMEQYNLGAAYGSGTYLWIARYGVSDPGPTPGWNSWTFWQQADHGSVPGITGDNVDQDTYNGDGLAGLRALIQASKLS